MKTIKPKYIAMVAGVLLFAHGYYLAANWLETNKLQSPIVIQFRAPWTDRFLSPIPYKVTATPLIRNTEPGIKVVTPKPSIVPPKKKKAQGFDLVGDVMASEVSSPSDEEIIAYIKSKDWDDDVAVALAKSENFWNLTKSFDCTRKGPINADGSQDYGIFQVNTIHTKTLAKMGMTMTDMLDCKKNIDFAFGHIYTTRGNWSAWSAYNNGSYLNHL